MASFFDGCFLLFLCPIYSPCILVLVFTGLCLAPLDGIKISGFVFSCRAAEWASLLLNSAAYALAIHAFGFQYRPYHDSVSMGLCHLKQSVVTGMLVIHVFELSLSMYHHMQPQEAITVCIISV